MNAIRRRPVLSAVAAAALVFAVVVLAFAFYLANAAGELPWQEDPTRVSTSLTPFADIFTPVPALPTATAAAGS